MCWLYEKVPVLKQRNAVRELLFIAIIEVIIEVEHFLVCLIKLRLIVGVEVVLGELELTDLVLHLIQGLIHHIGVDVVRLRDVFDDKCRW